MPNSERRAPAEAPGPGPRPPRFPTGLMAASYRRTAPAVRHGSGSTGRIAQKLVVLCGAHLDRKSSAEASKVQLTNKVTLKTTHSRGVKPHSLCLCLGVQDREEVQVLLEDARDVDADGAGLLVLRERQVELVVTREACDGDLGESFACAGVSTGRPSRGDAPAAIARG